MQQSDTIIIFKALKTKKNTRKMQSVLCNGGKSVTRLLICRKYPCIEYPIVPAIDPPRFDSQRLLVY